VSSALSETEIIERYLRPLGGARSDVKLGIGDDAALLELAAGAELVLTTDALVEAVHFMPGAPPRSLGHRALAVNLSDIAAMGAQPSWALLSLIMPAAQELWLSEFCAGFGALAQAHSVALVGGNLSRGPLSITLQLAGHVPSGQALRRDGAQPGDELYVSGTLGDAAAGRELTERGPALEPPSAETAYLRARFEYPSPRVALGQQLRGLASACIDLSDGLEVDVTRLIDASHCAGVIELEQLPLSGPLRSRSTERAVSLALAGGEDYELCFTAPAARAAAIAATALRLGERVTRIGALRRGAGLELRAAGAPRAASAASFDHFAR
jgi:thiamine-monophosphate kinase